MKSYMFPWQKEIYIILHGNINSAKNDGSQIFFFSKKKKEAVMVHCSRFKVQWVSWAYKLIWWQSKYSHRDLSSINTPKSLSVLFYSFHSLKKLNFWNSRKHIYRCTHNTESDTNNTTVFLFSSAWIAFKLIHFRNH